MPVDPEVALGTLPNGLKYYVRPNPRPARRVELRLVVKAGSVLEDPDQLGLAHFVEHMLFEGTTNFPGNGINDFLASLGLGIGADANAQTSYDDTQYILRVPSDSPRALDRALAVLKDWANAAIFEPSAIERQRKIVLSEWRQHLGAGERTRDKIRQVQLEGSQYANRSPIGFRSPQCRRAMRSLITTTCGASSVSPSVKSRPRTTAMRIVSKYAGRTTRYVAEGRSSCRTGGRP